MLIDPNKLKTPTNFADEKNITRQHVYRLIKKGEVSSINIDGVEFVIMDEKSKAFERKRK